MSTQTNNPFADDLTLTIYKKKEENQVLKATIKNLTDRIQILENEQIPSKSDNKNLISALNDKIKELEATKNRAENDMKDSKKKIERIVENYDRSQKECEELAYKNKKLSQEVENLDSLIEQLKKESAQKVESITRNQPTKNIMNSNLSALHEMDWEENGITQSMLDENDKAVNYLKSQKLTNCSNCIDLQNILAVSQDEISELKAKLSSYEMMFDDNKPKRQEEISED